MPVTTQPGPQRALEVAGLLPTQQTALGEVNSISELPPGPARALAIMNAKPNLPPGEYADIEAFQAQRDWNAENRNWASRAFLRGMNQVGSLGGGLAGWTGSASGIEGLRDWGFDVYKERERAASMYPGTEFLEGEGLGKVAKLPQWFLEKAIEQVPIIALTWGTAAPASMASGAGKLIGSKALARAAGGYIERQVAKQVGKGAAEAAIKAAESNAMKTLARNLSVIGTTTGLETGGNWGEVLDRTGVDNPVSAVASGFVSGLGEVYSGSTAVMQKMLGSKQTTVFRKALEGVGKAYGKGVSPDVKDLSTMRRILTAARDEALKTGTEEAIVEMFQELSSLANIAINDPSFEMFTYENLMRVFESGAAGFGVGTIMGGVSGGFNAPPRPPSGPTVEGDQREGGPPSGDINKKPIDTPYKPGYLEKLDEKGLAAEIDINRKALLQDPKNPGYLEQRDQLEREDARRAEPLNLGERGVPKSEQGIVDAAKKRVDERMAAEREQAELDQIIKNAKRRMSEKPTGQFSKIPTDQAVQDLYRRTQGEQRSLTKDEIDTLIREANSLTQEEINQAIRRGQIEAALYEASTVAKRSTPIELQEGTENRSPEAMERLKANLRYQQLLANIGALSDQTKALTQEEIDQLINNAQSLSKEEIDALIDDYRYKDVFNERDVSTVNAAQQATVNRTPQARNLLRQRLADQMARDMAPDPRALTQDEIDQLIADSKSLSEEEITGLVERSRYADWWQNTLREQNLMQRGGPATSAAAAQGLRTQLIEEEATAPTRQPRQATDEQVQAELLRMESERVQGRLAENIDQIDQLNESMLFGEPQERAEAIREMKRLTREQTQIIEDQKVVDAKVEANRKAAEERAKAEEQALKQAQAQQPQETRPTEVEQTERKAEQDEVAQLLAEIEKSEADRKAFIEKHGEVEMKGKRTPESNVTNYLHRVTSGKNKWRITYFDDKGPISHSEYTSYESALKDFERDVDGLENATISKSRTQQIERAKQLPATTPPQNESEYVSAKEAEQRVRDTYFDKDGKKVKSSRTTPAEFEPYPIGTWIMDKDFDGLYGHDVEQLRLVDVDSLLLPEGDYTKQNMEGRGIDAARYAEWLKKRGPQSVPPIIVVEMADGSGDLKVSDGHRRVAAAKLAGVKQIPAWVSPVMDTGRLDASGNPMFTGMTFEGMKYGAEKARADREIRENKNRERILGEQNKSAKKEKQPTPAPIEKKTLPQLKHSPGKPGKVYLADGSTVDVEYTIVPVGDLVISNNTDYSVNQQYPKELQPRDRARTDMRNQVELISQNIQPERVAESSEPSPGAPIVASDSVVESGNGRALGIQIAYKSNNQTAQAYRKWLIDNAESFGLTREQVEAIEQPILVRVRKSEMQDRSKFAIVANKDTQAKMSPVQQARADSQYITDDLLAQLEPTETSGITSKRNDGFMYGLLGRLPISEQGGLKTSDGKYNAEFVQRAIGALFYKAYQNDNLLDLVVEATQDNDIKNFINGLIVAAPEFAKARKDVKNGSVEQMVDYVSGAVLIIQNAKRNNMGLSDFLAQEQMFDSVDVRIHALARSLNHHRRSGKRIGSALTYMVQDLREQYNSKDQVELFDSGRKERSVFEIIQDAISRMESENGQDQTSETTSNRERKGVLPDAGKSRQEVRGRRQDRGGEAQEKTGSKEVDVRGNVQEQAFEVETPTEPTEQTPKAKKQDQGLLSDFGLEDYRDIDSEGNENRKLWSIRSGKTKGSTAAKIERIIAPIRKLFNIPIKVIQSVDELPGISRLFALHDQDQGYIYQGVYDIDSGTVYLIADGLQDRDEVLATVLRHELEAHGGLRKLFGEESALNDWLKELGTNSKFSAEIQQYAKDNDYDTIEEAAEEWIASRVETGEIDQNLWQKFVAAIRKALRALGLNLKINDADLRDVIVQAREAVRARESASERAGTETMEPAMAKRVRFSKRGPTQADEIPGEFFDPAARDIEEQQRIKAERAKQAQQKRESERRKAFMEAVAKTEREKAEAREAKRKKRQEELKEKYDIAEKALVEKAKNRGTPDPITASIGAFRGTMRVLKTLGGKINQMVGIWSWEMDKIAPQLRRKVRDLELNINRKIMGYMKRMEPYWKIEQDLLKSGEMTPEDHAILEHARRHSNRERINEIHKKYGMEKAYDGYRQVMDELNALAEQVGFDPSYLADYFPRSIKDVEGFLEYINRDDQLGAFRAAIDEKEDTLKRKLTTAEVAEIINRILRKIGGAISIGKPGSLHARTIELIDENLAEFYFDSAAATERYLIEMVKKVEHRKFFGRIDKRHVSEKLESEIIEESIGNMVAEMIANGELEVKDENRLQSLLSGYFNYMHTSKGWAELKNAGYIMVMGSGYTSMLTQFGDMTFSLYLSGVYETAKAAAKAIKGQSVITLEHVGLEHGKVAEEMSDPGVLHKWVKWLFRKTGLTMMDAIGKETLMNSYISKLQKEAQSGKFSEDSLYRLERAFGENTGGIIADLKSGEITDNVLTLAWSTLLDYQPVSITEMPPEAINHNGAVRLAYQLKTFWLRQINTVVREVTSRFVNAINNRNTKEARTAFRNMLRLGAFFIIANGSADWVKEELRKGLLRAWGASVPETKLLGMNGIVAENSMKIFGIDRYLMTDLSRRGIEAAVGNQLLPAVKNPIRDILSDILSGDIFSIKDMRTLKYLPLIGKHIYYSHVTRGGQYMAAEAKKDIYQQLRMYYATPSEKRDQGNYRELMEAVKLHNTGVEKTGMDEQLMITPERLKRLKSDTLNEKRKDTGGTTRTSSRRPQRPRRERPERPARQISTLSGRPATPSLSQMAQVA